MSCDFLCLMCAIETKAFSGSRGAPVIIGTSSSSSGRPLVSVPAPYVPEELVSQAQVVLQGKSRNLIIRELQVWFKSIWLKVSNFSIPIDVLTVFFPAHKLGRKSRCEQSSFAR